MSLISVQSFAAGAWIGPGTDAAPLHNAFSGALIGHAGGAALDVVAMRQHAIATGGPALRAMTFHDRARMLKALAQYLNDRKEALYELSYLTGATRADSWIDIDGGIGTMFVFASKGRREMPDAHVYLDGDVEMLSRKGSFVGQHVCTPLQGVALHINAFNFPVWGMLEKLAPTLLAGVPAIVKPATATGYLAEAAFRMIIESGLVPDGAVQLISGGVGPLLDHLGAQDAVSFTGSADTALRLRGNVNLQRNSVRFAAEQDSLNASVLGPDVGIDDPEFDLFIKEVSTEITAKAGQKCTAVRRILVSDVMKPAVIDALEARLASVTLGDPRRDDVQMGALASVAQKADVLEKCGMFASEARRVIGSDSPQLSGEGLADGAFVAPTIFDCGDPDAAIHVHTQEAFGPVACLLGYRDLDHAAHLANRGGGALVTSVITNDGGVAHHLVAASASHHGRLYFNSRESMGESTGHGSPLPHMVHGGPGRAGGSEELGGIRAVKHYMQRTALQGPPSLLSAAGETWLAGSPTHEGPAHPFRRHFHDLQLGETLVTPPRLVSADDIQAFADFTGDQFYAHTDAEAAAANPFFPGIVAHGYLLLSFAAGMFVEPAPGPVLANTGLNALSFQKPVTPGSEITVSLTVKRKTRRTDDYGEVRWHVDLRDQDGDIVATYELLTMVAI